jgi:ATP-dependent protease HslVU (ClpYQ) peptidase subunit
MTLCIAATCVDEKDNSCIVIASDFKAEVGDFAGAEIQQKLNWLYPASWPVLVAGTASDGHDIVATFREKFNRKGITEANARDRIMAALLEHKRKFTNEYVKATTNLDFDYFRDNKDKIDPTVWSKVWGNIGKIKSDFSLILCSFTAGVPLMFQVDGDFSAMPTEQLVVQDENFLAIGTGRTIANSMLCFRGQNNDMRLGNTVYNVFEAMRFARQGQAPGVGKIHAFSILTPRKNGTLVARRLKGKGIDFLKKQYDESFGPKSILRELKLIKGIWERY